MTTGILNPLRIHTEGQVGVADENELRLIDGPEPLCLVQQSCLEAAQILISDDEEVEGEDQRRRQQEQPQKEAEFFKKLFHGTALIRIGNRQIRSCLSPA